MFRIIGQDYLAEAGKPMKIINPINMENAVLPQAETETPKRGRPRAERPLVAFSISLPEELRRQIEEDAEREGRSVAGQIRHVLQRHYSKP